MGVMKLLFPLRPIYRRARLWSLACSGLSKTTTEKPDKIGTMNKSTYDQVRDEVKEAYADCWLPWEEGEPRRNLHFRASASVSPKEAKAIMKKFANGHNAFSYEILCEFPEDAEITIAREGSVCLYVTGKNLPTRDVLGCDEYDKTEDGSTRIWWD